MREYRLRRPRNLLIPSIHSPMYRPKRADIDIVKVGCIEIVLTGDANEREQGIAAGIGQRRPHPPGAGHLGNGADRPVRGDPLA
jgi:hypothetical protein